MGLWIIYFKWSEVKSQFTSILSRYAKSCTQCQFSILHIFSGNSIVHILNNYIFLLYSRPSKKSKITGVKHDLIFILQNNHHLELFDIKGAIVKNQIEFCKNKIVTLLNPWLQTSSHALVELDNWGIKDKEVEFV